MPIRTIATLAVAVFLGILAVLLVRTYLQSDAPARAPESAAFAPVVVASQAIDRGKVVDAKQLKVVNYPANSVPAGAFRSIQDISGASADKRIALRSMAANEPVLATRISGLGGRLVLSASLGEGMRAVTLKTNEVSGVAGFILPGDRVDILLTREVGEQNKTTVTQVVAENIRVLGVDQSDNDEADKPVVAKAVTVEATPNQAQVIALGQAVGSVSLALRQISDQAPLGRKAVTTGQLGFVRASAPASNRAAGVRQSGHPVRVTRGVDTAEYRVP